MRRQSLLGDAVSHAALPGIGIAFLLTGSKTPLILIIGAGLAGWLATALVLAITKTSRVKYDGALALMLSVFFGVGLVILTLIQKMPDASQAGLDSFLFGQAASLVEQDVHTMGAIGGVALLILGLFWKEFKLTSFDAGFAQSLHLPVRWLDLALTTLLVVAIVIGLQAVGVVLMSAMIIAPAVAARQWTDRLGRMVGISMGLGAASGVSGALISASATRLPTGPTIVLCATALVLVSIVLAPKRGLLSEWVRRAVRSRRLRGEAILLHLYRMASQHSETRHPHSESALAAMMPTAPRVHRQLDALQERGWVTQAGPQCGP